MTGTAVVSMNRQTQRKARKSRVLLAVDAQNMQSPAFRLDYTNLFGICQSMGELVSAAAFVTDTPAQINFQLMLAQNGYQVMRVRPVSNGNGESKSNADIQLAFWLGREVEKHRLGRGDTVVLCTGDGDFTQIVEWLRARDIRVVVIAFRRCTSPHLQIAASEFYPIEETPALQHTKPVSAA
jgi:uncharacterized LabA/DUF88 family protein